MRPELLVIGEATLRSYSTMLVVAAVIGVCLAVAVAVRHGVSAREAAVFYLACGLSVPFGARLLHIALNPDVYAGDPGKAFSLRATGFALYGGLLLAAAVGPLVARALRVDLWALADYAVPGLAASLVLVRMGCFLNGCCFGHVTDAPTGVVFPAGSLAHLWQLGIGDIGLFDFPLAVHPAQLYEASGAVIALLCAVWVDRRGVRAGVPFLAFVALFSAVRWVNWELFRVHPGSFAAPAWFYPTLYAGLIGACVALAVWRMRSSMRFSVRSSMRRRETDA